MTTAGARAGDKLILTKPLGIGIITTAHKAGVAAEETIARITGCVAALNDKASELMKQVVVHACNNMTGFGPLGHAYRVAQNSQIAIEIRPASVPFFPEAEEFAKSGYCPAGLHRNREFYSNMVEFAAAVPNHMPDILFDP